MTGTINLTENAINAFNQKIEERNTPDVRIRLGVRSGGCVGLQYQISYEDNPPREKDNEFFFNGIKVLVDHKSILYLDGITLDFEKTAIEQGFKIKNPREVSNCSCGKSFTMDKK
jgi:iron-sulfur cluster assembly protein